jgi:hypothetical protein
MGFETDFGIVASPDKGIMFRWFALGASLRPLPQNYRLDIVCPTTSTAVNSTKSSAFLRPPHLFSTTLPA